MSGPNAQVKAQLLIFRLGSIGDTVVALPCFHAIARRFPDHHKVLLTNTTTARRASSAETVLAGTGLIDEVMYYVSGAGLPALAALLRELRRRQFDSMVYLTDRPQSLSVCRDLLLFKLAGVRRIVGAQIDGGRRNPRVDPATGELEHEPERLARLLAPHLEVDLSSVGWALRLSAEEHAAAEVHLSQLASGHPVVALAPGAKVPRKDWGEDNWASLLMLLRARRPELSLVMIGAADERPLAERLANEWPGRIINTCGKMTPREAAALLARCDLLVCHDSGPMHLAASQSTPCTAIFGDYNRPRRWFPYGAGHTVIHEPHGVRSITAARVVEAIDHTLSRSFATGAFVRRTPTHHAGARGRHLRSATR